MNSFKSLCEEYFGTSDFYEVLQIERTATHKEIKKAYHKLSLLVHPDRVDEHHKKYATKKFQVLGRIHSILQDSDKRRFYDDNGEIDDEIDNDLNWMDYWKAMFKPISVKDIKKYEEQYIGSDTEKRDIKKAYESAKGNMDKMLEMIPFSNCESEERIQAVVRELIDDGEVEEYSGFFDESPKKKQRRHKKWKDEAKELAETTDLEDLDAAFRRNSEKRASRFFNMISNIEEKYGNKNNKRKSLTGPEKEPQKKRKRTARKQ